MNLALYAGATGMAAQQKNLDVIANNLANSNTTGFKKSANNFHDLVYQNSKLPGGDSGAGNTVPTGIQIGNGCQLASSSKIFTSGEIQETGEEKDLAIEGDGFFEVTMPDGTSSFTRDGALKTNSQGQVMTNQGHIVKSNFGVIPIGSTIQVATNGQVTVITPSGSQNFRIQLTRFANPSGLVSIGDNLYKESPASGTPETGNPGENGFGSIRQKYLEGSNVQIVQEMVNMIVAQRAYEINSKSIQTADGILAQVSQLKR